MQINTDRLWDLSQPIAHDGPAWAEYDPPVISHNYRIAAEGFNAETLHLNAHTGTHVDVPYHFDEQGATVDRVPLEAFAGPAAFLDLRDRVTAAEPIDRGVLEPVLDALSIGGWADPRRVSPPTRRCSPRARSRSRSCGSRTS